MTASRHIPDRPDKPDRPDSSGLPGAPSSPDGPHRSHSAQGPGGPNSPGGSGSGTAVVDELAEAEAEFATDPAPLRDLPRWVRWTVMPLLVLVPAGYVAISAAQSRGSGEDVKHALAGRQLTQVYPTHLQQRIYQVTIPVGSRYVRNLETNSWDTSVLYAEFITTTGGLDTFLAQIGTSRTALRPGKVAMTAAQSKAAGWNFDIPHPWAGISLHRVGDKPDHNITVDMLDPQHPRVYVVSTVNFQHGFGGG